MLGLPIQVGAVTATFIDCSCILHRYHKRPLTYIAVREFELCTAPWQACCDLLCPLHSLKGFRNFPWSIDRLDRREDRLRKNARALTERHNSLVSFKLNRSFAREGELQDTRAASKNSVPISEGRLLGSVRSPWDSSIYRDPLSKTVSDGPDGEEPAYYAAGNERTSAKDPFSSNVVPQALQKDISNQEIHARGRDTLTAEKSVQCGPGCTVQKHQSSWSAAKHAWVPPRLHVVGDPCSKGKGVLSQVCLSAPSSAMSLWKADPPTLTAAVRAIAH